MSTLHIYLDESGNLTFSAKGTKYYAFAAAWTYDPEPLARDLTRLRFGILKQGFSIEAFHACNDKQWCRNRVVDTLAKAPDWSFAAMLVEKRKVNPSIRLSERFYPQFMSSLLKFIFRGRIADNATQFMIFTDSLPMQSHKKAVEKTIKQTCATELGSKPFQLFHHKHESNKWIQVADYCSWLIHRKWEQGDKRTYDQLASHLHAEERDLLRAGDFFFY